MTKTRTRIIEEANNKVIFKTYRLNYPYGRKSDPTKMLIKTIEVKRKQGKGKW